MGGRSGEELLRLPVRFKGIRLGRPVDLMLDLEGSRVVGLEVLCGDEERRFLPLVAASVDEQAIAVSSPLLLLDEAELRYYRGEGSTLRALLGKPIERPRGGTAGTLRDVVVGEDGSIRELVLDADGGGARRVPTNGHVLFGRGGPVAPTSSPRRS
jgi:sporulation protein YlmC with PRC-barrel domain